MFYKKIHRLPIYSSFLFQVVVSDETEKINKHIGQKYKYYYAVCMRTEHNIKNGNFHKGITIVLNPNYYDNLITAGIIAHECIHAKNIIFQIINYRPKTANDEAEAYFMEYLVNYVSDFYNEVMKKEELLKKEK